MQIPKHLIPFLGITLVDLILRTLELSSVTWVSKPLLMISLAYYFYRAVPATALNRFVLAALGFSFLGDSLLMFVSSNDSFFLIGLISFALAHLIYIVINLNAVNEGKPGIKFQWQDIPFLLYGLGVFSLVKDGLGDMYFPALSYTVLICIMGMTARKRWKKTDNQSFWLIMTGAGFFIISDSLLAINRFLEPLPKADLLIMITYLLAQFLIVQGLVVFIKKIPQGAGSD